MTFTEIIKAVGGILFIVFIVFGMWMFCGTIVDKICSFFEDEGK